MNSGFSYGKFGVNGKLFAVLLLKNSKNEEIFIKQSNIDIQG
ncbi:MAG: hypothetical protein AABZ74_00975 [Cyanobacteriota bacterium]